MTPFIDDPDFTLYVGDVRDVLASLPDESVHCVVTSPPYWGLRDYGTGLWDGGDPDCGHLAPPIGGAQAGSPYSTLGPDRDGLGPDNAAWRASKGAQFRDVCGKCGARRVDRQLGLEPTPDLYVENMVAVFRQVRRVLRRDGTCWLNLGDSYATSPPGSAGYNDGRANREKRLGGLAHGLKPKDLVGVPWRVAFALQQPYYTGRIAAERDRVWLAAILDGEGTICGMRHTRPNGNVRTGCMVFITNTSEALLDECDRIWQGSRYSEKVTSEVSRPCWRWELQSAESRSDLVRELYPYLIEKKQQALVAYNLLEIVQTAKMLGRGGETKATKEKRDYLVRLLSDLNGRRPVDLPSWLETPPSMFEQGWYVRSDIIWSKKNPMPESVSDRPTKAHEYVFLLTRSPRYFYDADAIREPPKPEYARPSTEVRNHAAWAHPDESHVRRFGDTTADRNVSHPAGRNVRSVWEIATEPYPDAHFATFPQALVEPCVKAGTSERGCCPVCGAPWERETETERVPHWKGGHKGFAAEGTAAGMKDGSGEPRMTATVRTVGWQPSCRCDLSGRFYAGPVPCTVLDPFMGSGTTALVARRLGRRSIGVELNETYAELAARRLAQLSLLA